MIIAVPTDKNVPLIQDIQGTPAEIAERAEAFFRTAQFIQEAGGNIEVTERDREESRAIFSGDPLSPKVPNTSATAMHLKALITEYDHQVLESNIQARQYLVNRLLEISDPRGDTKPMEQLKALELLGKVSEIGLFTERIEVNINNRSTEELESELVSTLTKYMGRAVVVEKDPILGIDIDVELGRVEDGDDNDES